MKRFTSVLVIVLLLLIGVTPVSASSEEPKVFDSFGKSTAEYVQDEIIVKFKNDNKPFRTIKIPQGKVMEKVNEYSHRPDVVYAEPNYCAQTYSDDPLYNYQWNFHAQNEGGIKAEEAWGISTGLDASDNNEGVIVAIVDTGIAYENYLGYAKAPDFANTNFVPGYDFVNRDSHANDDNSHGTHVAGTVAQSTNNNLGVAGVAYNARLMPVKVLNKKGSGTYDNIALGIRWAANNGAKVINLSLGGPSPSVTLEDALAYAHDIKGVTIVAAAGNDGLNTISYPAAYDDYVIAVGATRYDKALASYSNYGTGLDLVAPGGDVTVDQNGDGKGDGILQNTFNPSTKNTSDFGYWFFQGTSMASPHVAGVAALLIANGNARTPSEVQSALQETALDLDLNTPGRDDKYGYGLVDAYAALNWGAEPNNAPIAVSPESMTTSEDTSIDITLTATDLDNDPLTYSIATGPAHGTLSGIDQNVVTYTPAENYNGSDSFTFRVSDGKLYSDPATVSITVSSVNDQPVASTQSVTTLKETPLNITLTANDPDNDPLTYSIATGTGPTHGTLSEIDQNVVTYTPNSDYVGEDSFTFKVVDKGGLESTAVVSIIVTEVPIVQTVNVSIDMTTATKIAGKNTFVWAVAKVSVGEPSALIANATVTGHWEGATFDTDTGTTGLDGTVLLMSDQVKFSTSQTFTFVVDSVTIGGVTYEPAGESRDSI